MPYDDNPDYLTEAYLMPMQLLAKQLRELARRTRPTGPDAVRRAILLEAAARLGDPSAWESARERDKQIIRGLIAHESRE